MWGSDAPAGTTFAGQEKLPKLPFNPKELAKLRKQKGNEYFKQKNYDYAVYCY